jgi:uncharacterized protein YcaQ
MHFYCSVSGNQWNVSLWVQQKLAWSAKGDYRATHRELSPLACEDGEIHEHWSPTDSMIPQYTFFKIQWNISKPTNTGNNKNGRFRGVAGFVRLTLQKNVLQGLKKSADIQGGSVFWGSGLEKFHCI